MKKITIYPLLFLACVLFSCTPVNPPQTEDESAQIVKILNRGMGQPAGPTLNSLAELGIEVPPVDVSEDATYDEVYHLKTKKVEIRILCQNGLIYIAEYVQEFRTIYAEGVKRFHVVDDAICECGWDRWRGGVRNNVTDLVKHEEVKAEIDAYIETREKAPSAEALSMYEKAYNDLFLFSRVAYSASTIGGTNLFTGEALDPMADNYVFVGFSLRQKSVLELY